MTKPELILPAGSPGKLQYALAYGADAVYAGSPDTSLRAHFNEFDTDSLCDSIAYTHARGKRIYVALNLFAHETDLLRVEHTIRTVAAACPDAFIVSDPGVLRMVRRFAIDVPIHLSTQANTTNSESVKFWSDQGVERIILARELRFEEVESICAGARDVEIELFIHGAMCVSYSGRCLLSSFLAGRDPNRGDCAAPCRWRYHLVEKTRPGELLSISEDRKGTYILNSKDLCLIDSLKTLARMPIAGYKVEGRTKNLFYVSLAARAYRLAIDAVFDEGKSAPPDEALLLLSLLDSHGYTRGFLFENGEQMQAYREKEGSRQSVLGIVEEAGDRELVFRAKNPLSEGDAVLGINPGGCIRFRVLELYEEGNRVQRAYGSKRQQVRAVIDRPLHGEGWRFGILARSDDRGPAG